MPLPHPTRRPIRRGDAAWAGNIDVLFFFLLLVVGPIFLPPLIVRLSPNYGLRVVTAIGMIILLGFGGLTLGGSSLLAAMLFIMLLFGALGLAAAIMMEADRGPPAPPRA